MLLNKILGFPLFEYFKSHLARQLFIRSQPFCHLHLLSWINDEDDGGGSQLPQKPLYEAVSNPPSAGLLSIYLYLCAQQLQVVVRLYEYKMTAFCYRLLAA